MKMIAHLFLAVFMPCVDHSGFRVPHMQDFVTIFERILMLFGVNIQFPVDKLERVLFVCRPEGALFNPDSIKIRAPNHEIGASFNNKFRIYLNDAFFI